MPTPRQGLHHSGPPQPRRIRDQNLHLSPLRLSLSGVDKSPSPRTLRNPHSTVKRWNLSNPIARMKVLNPPSSYTDRVLQGFGIAQAEALRLGSEQADATGPLTHRALQFPCATCLTNDSRHGPVFRPPQGTRRPCRGFRRVRGRRDDRATFRPVYRAPSRASKIPLLLCRFAQPA